MLTVSENTPSAMRAGLFRGCSHFLCNSEQAKVWFSQANQALNIKYIFVEQPMGLPASLGLCCLCTARATSRYLQPILCPRSTKSLTTFHPWPASPPFFSLPSTPGSHHASAQTLIASDFT